MNVMPPLKITNVSGPILSDPEVKADIVNGDGAETGQIITTTVPGYYGQSKQATCLEMGKSVVIKKVLQDRRYKNRELQIMWLLDHPNVVQLEHCFFLSNNMDKLYLNLVIEYLSETVYKVSKPYIKMHVPIPTIYVQLYTNQVNLGDTPSKDIQFRECKDVVTWRTKCIVYLLTVLSGPRANMWGYRIYNCDRYVIHGLYLD